jgi:hypothetical protein
MAGELYLEVSESLIFEVSYWRELDSLRSRVIQILAQLDELISQHKSRLR